MNGKYTLKKLPNDELPTWEEAKKMKQLNDQFLLIKLAVQMTMTQFTLASPLYLNVKQDFQNLIKQINTSDPGFDVKVESCKTISVPSFPQMIDGVRF